MISNGRLTHDVFCLVSEHGPVDKDKSRLLASGIGITFAKAPICLISDQREVAPALDKMNHLATLAPFLALWGCPTYPVTFYEYYMSGQTLIIVRFNNEAS